MPYLILQESRPRKFDRSRIGFESHEDVTVSYDMEIKPVKVKPASAREMYAHMLMDEKKMNDEISSYIFEPVNKTKSEEVENIYLFCSRTFPRF